MVKNTACFLMLLFILFMIAPVGAVSFPNNSCVPCNTVSITGLKLHMVTGITPIKVGFFGSVKGPVSKVKYTVTNPTTGA